MILQLVGLATVFVATYFVFKTAKENGRSPVLWGLITIAVGLGVQIALPIFLGVILAIYFIATGTPRSQLEYAIGTPAIILTLGCILLSFVVVIGILRFVARIPDDGPIESKPNELSIYHNE